MTKSYPSNKSVIIDAPGEIQIPDASFVYNFYLVSFIKIFYISNLPKTIPIKPVI